MDFLNFATKTAPQNSGGPPTPRSYRMSVRQRRFVTSTRWTRWRGYYGNGSLQTGRHGGGVAGGLPTEWAAIEQAVEQLLPQLGQQLVEAMAARDLPTARPECGVCHGRLRWVDPTGLLTVTGRVGDYPLTWAYDVGPAGHGSATPAEGGTTVPPGCQVPFEGAPPLASELVGIALMARRYAGWRKG